MNHFEQALKALLETKYKPVTFQPPTNWIGLYGQKICPSFICYDNGKELCFNVEFQDAPNTCEENLVFAVEQIKQCHQVPTYLILVGCSWSQGAISWVTSQPATDTYLGALTLNQFLGSLKKNG